MSARTHGAPDNVVALARHTMRQSRTYADAIHNAQELARETGLATYTSVAALITAWQADAQNRQATNQAMHDDKENR